MRQLSDHKQQMHELSAFEEFLQKKGDMQAPIMKMRRARSADDDSLDMERLERDRAQAHVEPGCAIRRLEKFFLGD